MTKMRENHMVLPYADDEPIPEPEEQEFERDTSLVDTLRDITLSQQISEVQDLIADLRKRAITKPQGE